jgi:RsiW-degrading membrane proteinase PrsW (M82 family)
MLIPAIVAIVLPIVFLYLVRWLDLYASGSFRGVVICFGWGIVAFFLSLGTNTFIASNVIKDLTLVLTVIGPTVEEIYKSLILIYFVRRSDFTYFVDGAIYGFSIGIGFAVVENIFYLASGAADQGLLVALGRVFSTSLMHGSATAMVGIALGRQRFGHGMHRRLMSSLGWVAAIALHITFNTIVLYTSGLMALVLLVGIGLGGLALVAVFIFWGLSEEKRWLRESLNLDVGVSQGESEVVQKMDNLDAVLAPVAETFGQQKRKEVEAFLRLQVQLGLKAKVQALTTDAKLSQELEIQIAEIRVQMDTLRRAVGVYCMSYVRAIIPVDVVSMYVQLQEMEVKETLGKGSMWSALQGQ